jgi:excisionase family DNA binding protein
MKRRRPVPEHMLTTEEVAETFRTSPQSILRWRAQGRIHAIRTPGGHYRWRQTEVNRVYREGLEEGTWPIG